jgi:serine/threonine protein phosphatase PrpC
MSRAERLNPATKIVMKTKPRTPCRSTASYSEMGGRSSQQDACQIWENPAIGATFVVLCDGVGGSRSGADASAIVIQTAGQLWNDRGGVFSDPKRDLFSLSNVARNRIVDLAVPGEKRAPASTIVALYVTPTEAHWIHAGDSRLYHFRDSQVVSRTRDHSVVQILVDQGEVREEEMGAHPDQGRLLQSLGSQEYRDPAYGTASIGPSDAFLLCTDGFWERTPPRLMASLFLAGPLAFESALRKVVARAVRANGPSGDNVTAAIVAPLIRPARAGAGASLKKLYPFLILLTAIMAVAGIGVFKWINEPAITPINQDSGGKTPAGTPVPASPTSAIPTPTPAPATANPAIPTPTPTPATANPAIPTPTPTLARPVPATPDPASSLLQIPGGSIVGSSSLPPEVTPETATKDHPFVNSLGMRFVPVEISGGSAGGKRVLFSIWDTRVQDYAIYARELRLKWLELQFVQTHPAVNVSWEDARAFCAWLSKKEGGKYRLPTDVEWSAAVGSGKYPWGDASRPPRKAGNYDQALGVDQFGFTSPVGSFEANPNGLYDMGGNVWQWCEDEYRPSMNDLETLKRVPDLKDEKWGPDKKPYRVLRGGSWKDANLITLRSSFHASGLSSAANIGFRCVLEISGE